MAEASEDHHDFDGCLERLRDVLKDNPDYNCAVMMETKGPTLHLGLAGFPRAEWVRITPQGGETIEYTNVDAGTWLDQRSYQ